MKWGVGILLVTLFACGSWALDHPTDEPSDTELAQRYQLTPTQIERLRRERSVSRDDIARMPPAKLKRALWRLEHPKPDHPGEAVTFRLQQQRDARGRIPDNALLRAWGQKRAMPFHPGPWNVFRKQPGPALPQAAVSAEGDPSDDAIMPLGAGIDSSTWTWIGPGNIGGRVRAILIHPTTPTTLWVGSVSGGIWKTVDGGASWSAVDDFMANLAVSSLVMDPGNSSILYAGTGEGFFNADAIRGAGIFKSVDGGTTWTQLSSTTSASYRFVNRLAIHPTNGQVLLAATRTGLFRTTNGGSSWSQVYSADMLDVDFDPNDGSKCIGGGRDGLAVYSTDGGGSWTAATGLPNPAGSFDGRVELAYAASASATVYASVDDASGAVYRSTNGGQSYVLRRTGDSYLGSQGWYDNVIWVDPTDADTVIVGGIDLWRSTDGGATFTKISRWYVAPLSAHADHHAIVAHPGFNGVDNTTVFFGNDGGIYRADDVDTVSETSGWTELNNNLGITQFYGAAGNAGTGTIVGGTQDNGTLRYSLAGGSEGWSEMYGGDGGFCAADPDNASYFYGEYVDLKIHRSSNGGLSAIDIYSGITDAGTDEANFIAPFILDPNNADRMLAGGSSLWRSTNVKATTPTWTAIKPDPGSSISAIAVAQGDSDRIWVGHNNGQVYRTENGTVASPSWTRVDAGSTPLPDRYCTRLTIDPSDPNRVYATFGGYNSGNVWRTADNGATWANISSGLPSAPVRSLVVAPFNSNYLYIGTEVGVLASENGGSSWSSGNDGPANVSVDELFWMGNTLYAATHGRGLFRTEVFDGPAVTAGGQALISEACAPGNGAVDPGESVTVSLVLTNASPDATSAVFASLQSTGGVTLPSGPQSYGALVASGPSVAREFSFTAAGNCGDLLTATLNLQDGFTPLPDVSFTFRLGALLVLLDENFDAVSAPQLPVGWSSTTTGSQAAWISATARWDSAPNAMYASEAGAVGDSFLLTPVMAVTEANARLTFRHAFDLETTFDGGVLEISIGGGAFIDILAAGGSFVEGEYTELISSSYSSPIAGRDAWSGDSVAFIQTTAVLPAAAAGQNVQLRWRCSTDASATGNGWYVDSVELQDGFSCCSAGGEDYTLLVSTPYGTSSPPEGPNSFAAGTAITATLNDSPVVTENAQQQVVLVVTGWVGTGSVPLLGAGTNTGPFTLLEDSTLAWLWAIRDLTVSNQTVGITTNYRALETVTAENAYRVVPAGDVEMDAGDSVRLRPGFTAEEGSQVRVRVNP